MQLLTVLFATGVLFLSGNCSCEYPHSDICHKILQSLENALIQDEANLYRSRKVFFYAPDADPVLLRIEYDTSFAENITEDVLPYCTNNENSSVSSTLNLTDKTIIRGWTSKGLYQWIEPLVLSRIQMALPFCILHWVYYYQKKKSVSARGNPDIASFLWDGSEAYSLDRLYINLHITSLPCIPSEEIFNSTIEELTTFVS